MNSNLNDYSAVASAAKAAVSVVQAQAAQKLAEAAAIAATQKASFTAVSSQQMLDQLVLMQQQAEQTSLAKTATQQAAVQIQSSIDTIEHSNYQTVTGSVSAILALNNALTALTTLYQDLTNLSTVGSAGADIHNVAQALTAIKAVAGVINELNTLAADKANFDTVAANLTNINAVSTALNTINAVTAQLSVLNALYADQSNFDQIVAHLSSINNVAAALSAITTVATNKTAIDGLYADQTNFDTVAANATSFSAVATALSAVTSVAGSLAALDALVADRANFNTVATNSSVLSAVSAALGSINSLATDLTALNALYADKATLDSLAGSLAAVNAAYADISNINLVGADKANIDAVAAAIAAITTCANNMAIIQASAGFVAQAQASATTATTQATAAAASSSQAATYRSNIGIQNQVAVAADLTSVSASIQDLSGALGAALHRSPNAVVALVVYDASKDSDGGLWIDKANNQSWLNETLTSTWLYGRYSGFASEMDARDWFGISQNPTANSVITGDSSTFSNGIGNWQNYANAIMSSAGGCLRMQPNGGNLPQATLAVPTTIGQRYRLDLEKINLYTTAGGSRNLAVYAGTTNGGTQYGGGDTGQAAGGATATLSFTATASTVYVQLSTGTQGGWPYGDYLDIDNVTLSPVNYSLNPSGAYYQSNVDGKFYRLWKNRLGSSSNFANTTSWGRTNILSIASKADTFGDLVVPTAASASHFVNQGNAVIGAPNTITVRAKAGGYSWIALQLGVNACYYDLINGVLGLLSAGSTASITPVPGMAGYYDCVFSTNVITSTNVLILIASANNVLTFAGDGVSGVYLAQAQLEMGSAYTAYEDKPITDQGVSQVYRGNAAKFPRLSAIVAEASNVTIYDLTQPGRPMWMQFYNTGVYNSVLSWGSNTAVVQCLAAINGKLCFGQNGGGGVIDFVADSTKLVFSNSLDYLPNPRIADRHNAGAFKIGSSGAAYGIVASSINSLAATVLPDAPVDPYTGLKIPTIAVATTGGVSLIRDDGSIINSSSTAGFSYVNFMGDKLVAQYGDHQGQTDRIRLLGAGFSILNGVFLVGDTSQAYSSSLYLPVIGTTRKQVTYGSMTWIAKNLTLTNSPTFSTPAQSALAFVWRGNSPASSMTAWASNTFNTGWMVGDVRRCWLSSNSQEGIGFTDLVANGRFDSDISSWSQNAIQGGGSWGSAGVAQLWGASGQYGGLWQDISWVVGKTYRISAVPGGTYASSVTMHLSYGQRNDIFGAVQVPLVNGLLQMTVTATAAIQRLFLDCNAGSSSGPYGTIDNVSIVEIDADRTYKNSGLSVTGSLTKTLSGGVAMYSGWANDNLGNLNTELTLSANFGVVSGDNNTLSAVSISGFTSNAGTTANAVYQTLNNLVPGAMYMVTSNLASKTTGSVTPSVVYNGNGTGAALVTGSAMSVGVAQTLFFIASASTHSVLWSDATSASAFAVSAISCKAYSATACSAVNNVAVLQELYSADWDFGTGAWRIGAWVNIPTSIPDANFPLGSELVDTLNTASAWVPYGNNTAVDDSGEVKISYVDSTAGARAPLLAVNGLTADIVVGKVYKVTGYIRASGGTVAIGAVTNGGGTLTNWISTSNTTDTPFTGYFSCTNAGDALRVTVNTVGDVAWVWGISFKEVGIACIFGRSSPTGPYIRLGMLHDGRLACEAYDGTTTRRATSTNSYNTGFNLETAFEYTTDGSLSIYVNGPNRVAQTTGTPLLTLNNSNALVTIGNARTLDAAFPGSIALVRATTTIPSLAMRALIYAQEAAMFQPGAVCTLPDNGQLNDASYDPVTNQLRVISATYESSWQGLNNVNVLALGNTINGGLAANGSMTLASYRNKVKLIGRTTIVAGVDVTIPAYALREELYNRAQAGQLLARMPQTFDYYAGFTCTTTNGLATLTAVANNLWPASVDIRGLPVSGANIPAGAYVLDVSGAVITISAPATAGGTNVQVVFGALPLPNGYEITDVYWSGLIKVEGSSKDFTRYNDGFCDHITPISSWGYNTPVRLKASKILFY